MFVMPGEVEVPDEMTPAPSTLGRPGRHRAGLVRDADVAGDEGVGGDRKLADVGVVRTP